MTRKQPARLLAASSASVRPAWLLWPDRLWILYIPKDDAALSAYSQSLVRRAASCQVTLAVRPLEAVFLRSRLRARLYEAILVPAASLPDGLEDQARVYEYKSYVLR